MNFSMDGIGDADYANINLIIEAATAFERSTYQCVYIVDFYRKNFLYVSNNIAKLCGIDAEKIKNFGYRFYIDFVPKDDLKMILQMDKYCFERLYKMSPDERKLCTFSYNFHFMHGNRCKLINHQLSPLILTKQGKVWLAICTISLAAGNETGTIVMKKADTDSYFELSLPGGKWNEYDEIALSDIEQEVLSLSTQGYTMNDIAKKIYKSFDTVKAYRRNIFRKMNVHSIAEALAYAQNHRLI